MAMRSGHPNGSIHPAGSPRPDELALLRGVASKFQPLEAVELAYLGSSDAAQVVVYVVAREHGLVDREALFDFEDEAAALLHRAVDVRVTAHQGRGAQALAYEHEDELLFARD
jgi:hypothetical protein